MLGMTLNMKDHSCWKDLVRAQKVVCGWRDATEERVVMASVHAVTFSLTYVETSSSDPM